MFAVCEFRGCHIFVIFLRLIVVSDMYNALMKESGHVGNRMDP